MSLSREEFIGRANVAYGALRADPAAWAELERERRSMDGCLMDGLDPRENWAEDGSPIPPRIAAMADLRRIIDEAKPMLEEFLSDIGLHRMGSLLDFTRLLKPLSRWVDAQEITEDDHSYLASRIGAFICEYLIELRAGRRVIEGGRILMRVPLRDGVMREFDPYAIAFGMIANRSSLQVFLDTLGT